MAAMPVFFNTDNRALHYDLEIGRAAAGAADDNAALPPPAILKRSAMVEDLYVFKRDVQSGVQITLRVSISYILYPISYIL
jgi:hypothetical protein